MAEQDELPPWWEDEVLLKYMRCHHEYEGVDNTSRIVCRKCGLETTVEALAGIARG